MSKKLSPALASVEDRIGRMTAIIDELKGEDIVVLDLRGLCDFTDAFIIATARSTGHMQGVIQHLLEELREEGLRPLSQPEGRAANWSVLDYGSVVVHLFSGQSRAYYDLEALWGDAKALDWQQSVSA